ncbi:MAG: hypothetical protein Q7T04_06485, partial [Dehalococcoidia bacterium]|nr:hypothetical protein [Dehalococcoidia bacterium]
IAEFNKMVDEDDFIDQARASELIAEGRHALDTGNQKTFVRAVWDLGKLTSGGITDPYLARFGGLARHQ